MRFYGLALTSYLLLCSALACSDTSDAPVDAAPDPAGDNCRCESGCPSEGTVRFIWTLVDESGAEQTCEEAGASTIAIEYEENAPGGGHRSHEVECVAGSFVSPLLSNCTYGQGEGWYNGYATLTDGVDVFGTSRLGFYPGAGDTRDLNIEIVTDGRGGYYGFGTALAVNGDTMAVGAPLTGINSQGAVYIFRQSGDAWQYEARLMASEADVYRFGGTLALEGDTLAVGSGGSRVHVFTRGVEGWLLDTVLASPLYPTESVSFGKTLVMHSGVLAVSAPEDANEYTSMGALDQSQGQVYLFRRNDTGWVFDTALPVPAPTGVEGFGRGLALFGDTIATTSGGNILIFERLANTWTEVYRAPGYQPAGAASPRSAPLALGQDVLAVTRMADSAGSTQMAIIERSNGVWTERARVGPAGIESFPDVGDTIAIDGTTIVADFVGYDGTYTWRKDQTSWLEEPIALPSNGPVSGFGELVAVSGGLLFVSARYDNNLFMLDDGGVFVFAPSQAAWTEIAKLVPPAPNQL